MGSKQFWLSVATGFAVIAAAVGLANSARAASNGKLLYSFTGGNDGGAPHSWLTFDSAGNAYGTTVTGGSSNFGTVFELKRLSSGQYQEIALYSFAGIPDGKNPYGGVTMDAAGNLYGTTAAGGIDNCGTGDGCGTVFKLSKSGSTWTESVLYSFVGGNDGFGPGGGVVFDKAGKNLFGTTPDGGANSAGTIFELSPTQGGQWQERVIHSFTGGADGGVGSLGSLLVDGAGNLYGVTEIGGAWSAGTVFRLSPVGAGKWQLTTLYAFKGQPDAAFPYGGLNADSAGNLYGTTYFGGTNGLGAVFKLDRKLKQESVLYSFQTGNDGNSPTSTLIFDTKGNLYGTTSAGGNPACDCGAVIELSPSSGGQWKETVLHRFGNTPDGANPYYGMTADRNGNFFSTTVAGGAHGQGILFSFTP